jgi:hypothetical protein
MMPEKPFKRFSSSVEIIELRVSSGIENMSAIEISVDCKIEKKNPAIICEKRR